MTEGTINWKPIVIIGVLAGAAYWFFGRNPTADSRTPNDATAGGLSGGAYSPIPSEAIVASQTDNRTVVQTAAPTIKNSTFADPFIERLSLDEAARGNSLANITGTQLYQIKTAQGELAGLYDAGQLQSVPQKNLGVASVRDLFRSAVSQVQNQKNTYGASDSGTVAPKGNTLRSAITPIARQQGPSQPLTPGGSSSGGLQRAPPKKLFGV